MVLTDAAHARVKGWWSKERIVHRKGRVPEAVVEAGYRGMTRAAGRPVDGGDQLLAVAFFDDAAGGGCGRA